VAEELVGGPTDDDGTAVDEPEANLVVLNAFKFLSCRLTREGYIHIDYRNKFLLICSIVTTIVELLISCQFWAKQMDAYNKKIL
jgi:hypothetical protein